MFTPAAAPTPAATTKSPGGLLPASGLVGIEARPGGCLAELIVELALLLISDHVISRIDLFEFVCRCRRLVEIGVVPTGQLLVGLADGVLIGAPRDTQD
jgi:hypothetical protein